MLHRAWWVKKWFYHILGLLGRVFKIHDFFMYGFDKNDIVNS